MLSKRNLLSRSVIYSVFTVSHPNRKAAGLIAKRTLMKCIVTRSYERKSDISVISSNDKEERDKYILLAKCDHIVIHNTVSYYNSNIRMWYIRYMLQSHSCTCNVYRCNNCEMYTQKSLMQVQLRS